ncbi:ATP synthase F1 subcomplex delta subunit [Stackebrandtia endophytica]|uniref:ATP synthase subunit delta n=1 Tax=Stackebrandtia endophytica TaxID=1496996 RepID=A0A543B0D1_9ACTN|nr:F0F1 ATP synthase subunit delta [Stackebrandtia endophytica]TQL78279.1 ATP synthase F1 subcomplex delta subunit [Stackebrandtia endophytica]
MSATGQESLQAGYDALAAYAKRVKPETLLKVAGELLAVRDAFANEPRLRRALTDPGQPVEARTGLAEQLLSGKVSAGSLKIVLALVKGRWATPGELLSGLESVGVDALLSTGLTQGVLGDVEDELFRFGRLVDGDSALASTLGDSSADTTGRVKLVNTLLSGKANPITVRLVELAVRGYGGRGFEAGIAALVDHTAAKRDQRVAYITVASPLPQDQENRLTERLSEIYRQPVSAQVTIDPEIVGGIRVQIGHDLYDGTVARRLTEARKALAGGR